MIDVITGLLKDVLLAIVWWILLFPVVILAATPIIVLISLIGAPKDFVTRLGDNFRRVIHFWADWGILLVP